MEERASGIILRTRTFTETSLVVEWLTAEWGRISTVAKGARRAKSPFLGKLDLFYEADFTFVRSRRSGLHTLREVELRESHGRLREELAWVHQAAYFAVLAERGTEAETPIAEIYQLVVEAVGSLEGSRSSARILFAYELKLLTLLGYEPELEQVSAETQKLALALKSLKFSEVVSKPSARAFEELDRFLQRSIGSALEYLPPQREKALLALMRKAG
jgi:DNA repair protein RecO (recombination protein O)